jgi:hypothetical protein
VNKDNVADEAIGTILSKGFEDGDSVRAKIIIHDTDEIKYNGLRELSLGYSLDIEHTSGEWNGVPYDAIQRNIRINHLALVKDARAGDNARLNIDGSDNEAGEGENTMAGKTSRAARGDNGLSADDIANAIAAYQERKDRRKADAAPAENAPAKDDQEEQEAGAAERAEAETDKVQLVKDRRDRRDQEGDPDTTERAMGIISQQDEDIDALLEVIEGMKAEKDFEAGQPTDKTDEAKQEEKETEQAMNADSIDAILKERLALIRLGDRLRIDGIEEMTPIFAKKAIIKAVSPQMRLDGKSAAYINVAFDLAKQTIREKKDTEYQRRQVFNMDSRLDNRTAADTAREKMIERQGGRK